MFLSVVGCVLCLSLPSSDAFAPSVARRSSSGIASLSTTSSMSLLLPDYSRRPFLLHMSETQESSTTTVINENNDDETTPVVDAATRLAIEKQRKADLLRSQEVFMKRSTGIHECTNCGWEYNPEKGDAFLIGGMIKPGVAFDDLPSNWRCPTCRSSKDGFKEVVETIPGFEVNQGYGFGTNSMTTGQKNALIWGGIGGFFLLFIGGYALS